MIYEITIKETGERITVYKLANGNYYDYANMGEHQRPSAPIAGKKEFKKEEITIEAEIK